MDKKGLQLTSRFSLPPNSLGYCGKGSAPAKLIECVIGGKCAGVDEELTKFIVLNPYLETLAAITGKGKFSHEVIEAYWLGNDELQKAQAKDYEILMGNFARQGVPEWLLDELKQKIPGKFIPFHLFQVLHVGVGRASGSVPYNMETINNCMVRWGTVVKIKTGVVSLELRSLEKDGDKYELATINKDMDYREDFIPGLKTGDTVAVHWKQVVKKLTARETRNLQHWTKEVLATVREQVKSE